MPPRYAYWTILIDDKPTAFPYETAANGASCGQACHAPRTYDRGNP